MKRLVKAKVDGKYFTFGNVQPGKYNERLGLRVTPELRTMIAGAGNGDWLNFNLYPEKAEAQAEPTKPYYPSDDDEIPF